MIEYLLSGSIAGLTGGAAIAAAAGGAAVLLALVALGISRRRQRALLVRLDDRMTHLAAGVSLLTNTTEEGLRSIALEIARLASVAQTKPEAQLTARQRITVAAGHGRSVQDIAASEQISESEVLLHLLLDRLRPEAATAEA